MGKKEGKEEGTKGQPPQKARGQLLYSSMNPNRNRPFLFSQIQPQFPTPLGNKYFDLASDVNQDGAPGTRSSRAHQKVKGDRERPKSVYFEEVARSQFVLGLPGMGYDCYRLWESLLLGSIPVIERTKRQIGHL